MAVHSSDLLGSAWEMAKSDSSKNGIPMRTTVRGHEGIDELDDFGCEFPQIVLRLLLSFV
jgi:hypothetical protein